MLALFAPCEIAHYNNKPKSNQGIVCQTGTRHPTTLSGGAAENQRANPASTDAIGYRIAKKRTRLPLLSFDTGKRVVQKNRGRPRGNVAVGPADESKAENF